MFQKKKQKKCDETSWKTEFVVYKNNILQKTENTLWWFSTNMTSNEDQRKKTDFFGYWYIYSLYWKLLFYWRIFTYVYFFKAVISSRP